MVEVAMGAGATQDTQGLIEEGMVEVATPSKDTQYTMTREMSMDAGGGGNG